jgi:hypothetical protein
MDNEVTFTPSKHLRELRLWHWKQMLEASRRSRDMRLSVTHRAEFDKQHSFHMKAVQTLNDYFAPGDTAEQDHARELRVRLPKRIRIART